MLIRAHSCSTCSPRPSQVAPRRTLQRAARTDPGYRSLGQRRLTSLRAEPADSLAGAAFAFPPGVSRTLRFPLVSICLLIALAPAAAAQNSLGSERRDIDNLAGDVWAVWTSPVHIGRRDLIPTLAVVAGVALTSFRDSAIFVWMTKHPNTLLMRMISPIRDGWRLPINGGGNGQFLLPLSAVLYTTGRLSHSADLRDAGLGCAASHLTSAALRSVIYFSVYRNRPHETADPRDISFPGGRVWSRHSFLSGHIANSMGCASYLSHRYSLGVLEPAMYAYATTIGLGRMADGWHWTSDTMAGAILGFAIGKAMADRQMTRAARRAAERVSTSVASSPVRISILSITF